MAGKSYPKPKLWSPKNPQKYAGDSSNIWVRSSWELKVYKWMDSKSYVINWSSEEIAIPYLSPVDNRWHKYYPDVLARIDIGNKITTFLVEIKPYNQTIEPKTKKRITKNYINEVCTWGINSAKWKAAKEYCLDRKWEFKLLTEKDLF
jgi:hypothetical protein